MNPEIIRGFHASEFVPAEIYNHFGANESWWFIRPEVIAICEFMRTRYGKPVTINNWKAGGKFSYRGYRPRAYDLGGENSQHRLGGAADVNVEGHTSDEIRTDIITNKSLFMPLGLTTLEDAHFAPTWVHLDTRPTGMSDILIVKPIAK
jgi:hypothetical protein